MYQLKPSYQTYNDNKYLDYEINADNIEPNVRLVGDRVSSYGVIEFGEISDNRTKSFKLLDRGIEQSIMLRSITGFSRQSSTDFLTWMTVYLEDPESVGERLPKQQVYKIWNDDDTSSYLSHTFAPGVIIAPEHIIKIKPTYHTVSILICWQPVHLLSYTEV